MADSKNRVIATLSYKQAWLLGFVILLGVLMLIAVLTGGGF